MTLAKLLIFAFRISVLAKAGELAVHEHTAGVVFCALLLWVERDGGIFK